MFVNEFISESEVSAEGLDVIRRRFNPTTWAEGRPQGFVHTWTIDRSIPAYLWNVKRLGSIGATGRHELTTAEIVILNISGSNFEFEIDRSAKGSMRLSDNPYVIVWMLKREPTDYQSHAREVVLDTLKKALTAHGEQGVYLQAKNTIVKFEF